MCSTTCILANYPSLYFGSRWPNIILLPWKLFPLSQKEKEEESNEKRESSRRIFRCRDDPQFLHVDYVAIIYNILFGAHPDKKLTSCQRGWQGRTCPQSQSANWSGSYHRWWERAAAQKLINCLCGSEGGRSADVHAWRGSDVHYIRWGDSAFSFIQQYHRPGRSSLAPHLCTELNQLAATNSTISMGRSFKVPVAALSVVLLVLLVSEALVLPTMARNLVEKKLSEAAEVCLPLSLRSIYILDYCRNWLH